MSGYSTSVTLDFSPVPSKAFETGVLQSVDEIPVASKAINPSDSMTTVAHYNASADLSSTATADSILGKLQAL
jgi:hypothetical protein